MTDIVTAVYELVGRHPDAAGPDVDKIKDKVERIFMVSSVANRMVIVCSGRGSTTAQSMQIDELSVNLVN